MNEYMLTDDAKVGAPLKAIVRDDTFAYGLEIEFSRGTEKAYIVLDYFNGDLVVRQYSDDGEDQIGSMSVKMYERTSAS